MRRALASLSLLPLLPLLSCSESPALPSTCNGHAELCALRYDEVAFPATHNSMGDTDTGIAVPNQTHPIAQQLEDGIRGLMLDTHYDPVTPSQVLTCHGLCFSNNRTLVDELVTIGTFLDSHRDAIVTIIFESGVSAADTAAAFETAGVLRYAYAHTQGQPWPTLRSMIESDERLVVFTDAGGGTETGTYPWYMDQWVYGFQNPYAAMTDADFACNTVRGVSGPGQIFIMNHFLSTPFGSIDNAMMVNPYASLKPHVDACQTEQSHIPNFVTVDFYEVGDLLRVVDELNGVAVP